MHANQHKFFLATIWLVALALILSACGESDDVVPTEIRVITSEAGSDPDLQPTIDVLLTQQVDLIATINAQSTMIANLAETSDASVATTESNVAALQTETFSALQTATATTPTPEVSPEPSDTPLPSFFPTPRIEQTIIVEQVFENGRMFWFRDSHNIWVLTGAEDSENKVDPTQGDWQCFADTFEEGDIESLPEFEPAEGATTASVFPDAKVQQPIRGFGKLWRENEELRELLGFALTSEIEYSGRREYVAGGLVDATDTYTPAPGEWRLFSFYGNGTYVFLEKELGEACPTGTWRFRN